MSDLVMGGDLGDFGVSSILEAVSLSRQHTVIRLWDSVKRPSGELRIKAGQVLDVECQGERGQPAFHLLLRRPHHSFRVEKLPDPANFPRPVGALFDLLSQFSSRAEASNGSGATPAPAERAPAAPNPPASANTGARAQAAASKLKAAREAARASSPARPPSPKPSGAKPVQGAGKPAASAAGQDGEQQGRLSPCQRSWTNALGHVPHLRGLILMRLPDVEHGEYWTRDGSQISIADLGAFGVACIRARHELPEVMDALQPSGYRTTAEHRLGCVVADIDISGVVRICLFDPGTPLGMVRHNLRRIIALSGSGGAS